MEILRLVHKAFSRARGYYPAKLGGRSVRVDPYHMEFWQATTANTWEPDTFRILSRYLNPRSIYYDIGSWIGPTAIYAAELCRKAVCFEPDPVAYQYFLWNLRLNPRPNVLPLNIALADRDSAVHMGSMHDGLGDSMTSLLRSEKSKGSAEVMALTWKTWLSLRIAEEPDFMKIDIEGSEFSFLPTMRDYLQARKPTIYLSTHSPFVQPNERAREMAKVLDVIALYKKCLNENLEPLDPQSLMHEEALGKFHSLVLED